MSPTKPRKNKIKNKRQSGDLSAEDERLWAHVTTDVRPLTRNQNQPDAPKEQIQTQAQPNKPKLQGAQPAIQHKRNASSLSYRHGQAPGLDKRTQTRLKRGQVTIEARLDLHGMTQSEAHRRLIGFLEAAYHGGRRTVLVITGKGLRQSGEIGVLRRAVPGWLNEPPVRDWIKAFDHAAPRDGGEGALYILLRRQR